MKKQYENVIIEKTTVQPDRSTVSKPSDRKFLQFIVNIWKKIADNPELLLKYGINKVKNNKYTSYDKLAGIYEYQNRKFEAIVEKFINAGEVIKWRIALNESIVSIREFKSILNEIISEAQELTSDKLDIRTKRYLKGDESDIKLVNPSDISTKYFILYQYIDSRGKYVLLAFRGRKQKAWLWRGFPSESDIQKYINNYLYKEMKDQVDYETKKGVIDNPVYEGNILYATWGYEQTNVNFYEVITVKGKMVIIRELEKNIKPSSHSSMAGTATPKSKYVGLPMKKKMIRSGNGTVIKISDRIYAHKWDGNPKSISWWA